LADDVAGCEEGVGVGKVVALVWKVRGAGFSFDEGMGSRKEEGEGRRTMNVLLHPADICVVQIRSIEV
jgi:hypothetical protein